MGKPEEVAKSLLDRGAVVIRPSEPFRYASGILSPIYCDNRLLLSDPVKRNLVIDGLTQLAKEAHPDFVAGTATAGIAWGAWVADRLNLPFAYVRAEAKSHGKGKRIEGEVVKGSSGVLIEDLITTGGSAFSAADALVEERAKVKAILAIFTYQMAETKSALNEKDYSLRTLVNLDQLLSVAVDMGKISASDRKIVEVWRNNPKLWPGV